MTDTTEENLFKAIVIVHWPGKDTPACLDHALKLQGLAKVMGVPLSCTLVTEEIECTNCLNLIKKKLENKGI